MAHKKFTAGGAGFLVAAAPLGHGLRTEKLVSDENSTPLEEATASYMFVLGLFMALGAAVTSCHN